MNQHLGGGLSTARFIPARVAIDADRTDPPTKAGGPDLVELLLGELAARTWRRSGLAEDSIHLRAADRTGALGHPTTAFAGVDFTVEVTLLFALDAISVVALGHDGSSMSFSQCQKHCIVGAPRSS